VRSPPYISKSGFLSNHVNQQWVEVECEVSNPVETGGRKKCIDKHTSCSHNLENPCCTVRTHLSTDVLDDLGAIYGIVKKVEALREAMILESCGLAGVWVEALRKVLRARGLVGEHLEEPCGDLRKKERSETSKPRDGKRRTASWQEVQR
jgi:hypothetical protein